MRIVALHLIAFLISALVQGQSLIKLTVIDSISKTPIATATVKVDNTVMKVTDNLGVASFSLSVGSHHFIITTVGFHEAEFDVTLPLSTITVALYQEGKKMEEITIISSTRNNQCIENSPLKVEVLGREEMEEENTIKPANIASILGDISGVQIHLPQPGICNFFSLIAGSQR